MTKIELDAKELADLCTSLDFHIREVKRVFGTTELGITLTDELRKTLLKLDEARREELKKYPKGSSEWAKGYEAKKHLG